MRRATMDKSGNAHDMSRLRQAVLECLAADLRHLQLDPQAIARLDAAAYSGMAHKRLREVAGFTIEEVLTRMAEIGRQLVANDDVATY